MREIAVIRANPLYTSSNMPKQSPVASIKQLLVLSLCGALLGGLGGVITLVFIKLLKLVQHAVWESFPAVIGIDPTAIFYPVVICTIGGFFVGVAIKYLGNYPKNLQDDIAEFKKTKEFDYQHIPQTIVNSLLSLGFGAALGPEAALTSIIGGFGTWVSKKLRFLSLSRDDLRSLGFSSTLGALFGSPLGSAAIASTTKGNLATKLQLHIATFIAALSALLVFRLTPSSGGNYFDLATLPYIFAPIDLAKAIGIGFVGFMVGVIFLWMLQITQKIFSGIKNQVMRAMVGGLLLGSLAAIWPLVLFSGHEGVQELMGSYLLTAGGVLIIIALAKSLAATSLLATGWKGGQFFPVMFTGSAIGLGIANIIPGLPPMVGIVAGMTAMLGTVLKKPLVGGLFVLFFFPPDLYPIAIMSMLTVIILMRLNRKKHFTTLLDAE
jgi:H+/Cl- antiporter ClcA